MSRSSPSGFLLALLMMCPLFVSGACALASTGGDDPPPARQGASPGGSRRSSVDGARHALDEQVDTTTVDSHPAPASPDGHGGDAVDALPTTSRPVAAAAWRHGDPSPQIEGFAFAGLNARGLPEYDMFLPCFDRANPDRVAMRFVLVPAGSFEMGSPSQPGSVPNEQPQHSVTVASFLMQKTEVTQRQYAHVTGRNPASSPFESAGLDAPVDKVSQHDAQEFLASIGLNLPSEAEWEYAARADGSAPRSAELGETAWIKENSARQPAPVGLKAPNGYGLHDMLGNAWELCADTWHPDYRGAPTDGTSWDEESIAQCITRGGSYLDPERFCNPTYRDRHPKSRGVNGVGFRAVKRLTDR